MRLSGICLMLVGVMLALVAFGMDTSVSVTGTFIAGQYLPSATTVNLGLLQQQMMLLHSGLAAFIAGAVFYANAPAEAVISDEAETVFDRDDRNSTIIRVSLVVALFAAIILAVYLASGS